MEYISLFNLKGKLKDNEKVPNIVILHNQYFVKNGNDYYSEETSESIFNEYPDTLSAIIVDDVEDLSETILNTDDLDKLRKMNSGEYYKKYFYENRIESEYYKITNKDEDECDFWFIKSKRDTVFLDIFKKYKDKLDIIDKNIKLISRKIDNCYTDAELFHLFPDHASVCGIVSYNIMKVYGVVDNPKDLYDSNGPFDHTNMISERQAKRMRKLYYE